MTNFSAIKTPPLTGSYVSNHTNALNELSRRVTPKPEKRTSALVIPPYLKCMAGHIIGHNGITRSKRRRMSVPPHEQMIEHAQRQGRV